MEKAKEEEFFGKVDNLQIAWRNKKDRSVWLRRKGT